jgi:hypothetical protein
MLREFDYSAPNTWLSLYSTELEFTAAFVVFRQD